MNRVTCHARRSRMRREDLCGVVARRSATAAGWRANGTQISPATSAGSAHTASAGRQPWPIASSIGTVSPAARPALVLIAIV